MAEDLLVAPSLRGDSFVELAKSQQGTLFRKHILSKGSFLHPHTKAVINLDDKFFNKMIDNFKNEVCDIVQVPVADKDNNHTNDPDRNVGEVVGLELENDKLYAIIDARKNISDFGKTYLGASAMFSQDYENTKTGERVGPTLVHTVVTNHPYISGLEGFEEMVAATNSGNGSNTVFLTVQESKMGLPELLAELKTDHNIDVEDLQSRVSEAESAVSLSNKLQTAFVSSGVLKLSNGSEVSSDDLIGAVAQVATDNVALSAQVRELVADRAALEVDGLVRTGFILPAQRDTMLDVKLTNPDLFARLLPAAPLVKLSHEDGITPPDASKEEDIAIALSHALEVAQGMGIVKK